MVLLADKAVVNQIKLLLNFVWLLLKQKVSVFGQWKKAAREVSNWLFCYVVTTSLLINIGIKLTKSWSFWKNSVLTIKYRNGMRLKVPLSSIQNAASLAQTYSKYIGPFGNKISFGPQDVVIDVGAHIGSFCVPLAYMHPKVRIMAFEPDPTNWHSLKQNIAVNPALKSSIKAINKGVYSSTGRLSFVAGSSSTTGSIANAGFYKAKKTTEQFSCDTVSLSDLFFDEKIEQCRLLKMDCEGSEYEILKGSKPDLLNKIAHIILEAHPTTNAMPADIKHFMEANGFKCVHGVDHQNGCWDFYFTNQQIV